MAVIKRKIRRAGVPVLVVALTGVTLGGLAQADVLPLKTVMSSMFPGLAENAQSPEVQTAESARPPRPQTVGDQRQPKTQVGEGRFRRVDPHTLGMTGLPVSKVEGLPVGMRPDQVVNALVELSTAPVSVQEAARGGVSDLGATLRQITAEQTGKDAAMHAAGASVEGRLTHVLNAVRVRVKTRDLAKVAAIPGVQEVRVAKILRLQNGAADTYTGVGSAWQNTKATGAGTVIGVLDTGIDFTHADFGGPGTVAAYDAARAVADKEPPSSMFPTAKVIGGWDFVGDAYNPDDPGKNTPKPDANPIPCVDHGTHVAGTAAGAGVTADGKTFAGPYNASTLPGNFKVAPGAAPEAKLRTYKVFGCDGGVTDDILAAAIDRAAADGVDVINMSVGWDFGDANDLLSKAVDNATKAGVLVVASAGNAGPNAYVNGSPGSADTALSVAAVDASSPMVPGATLTLPGGGKTDVLNANDATFSSFTADVALAGGKAGTLGCDAADYAGAKGKIVITVRGGNCARIDRAVLGQKAGAKAVIMINNSEGMPLFEGPIEGVTIPFLGMDASGPVEALNKAASLTVTPSKITNTGYAKYASFTSAGPNRLGNVLKPDIAGPGVSLVSAGMGKGTGAIMMSGTSMSSPHVAGIAALVRQAHPGWTPLQVKAALISTADPGKIKDYATAGGPTRGGTGMVQAARAVDTVAYASTNEGRDNLSFGFESLTAKKSSTRSYKITNMSGKAITYDLTTQLATPSYGASIVVSPTRLTVPAKASGSVKLTITMSPTAIADLPSITASDKGALTRLAGTVVATPKSKGVGLYPLRTAFLLVPQGASDVKARATTLPRKETAPTATLTLANTGLHDSVSKVFAWTQTDPAGDTKDPNVPDIIDVGVQSVPGSEGGLPADKQLLVFAVNTSTGISAHGMQEIDINVDTDSDGKPDYVVVVGDVGFLGLGSTGGGLGAYTMDIRNPDKNVPVEAWSAPAPANGSFVLAPVSSSAFGLTKDHSTFSFTVESFSLYSTAEKDATDSATFDAFKPVVSTGDEVTVRSKTEKTVSIKADTSQLSTQTAKGWLVVTEDDVAGRPTADEVPLHLK
jgi:minor extracellular serine protease Vpr